MVENVYQPNQLLKLFLSEVISDLVKPLVDTCLGGREVISTKDLKTRLVALNKTNIGRSKWSWRMWGEYVACGKCVVNWGACLKKEFLKSVGVLGL